jgi:hypothetical protein
MPKYELAGILALPQVWDRMQAEWDAMRCTDRTRSPRGWLRCTLIAGHDADPRSLHEIDFSDVIPYDNAPTEGAPA